MVDHDAVDAVSLQATRRVSATAALAPLSKVQPAQEHWRAGRSCARSLAKRYRACCTPARCRRLARVHVLNLTSIRMSRDPAAVHLVDVALIVNSNRFS